ncbi:peptidylprolyl isomerase [Paenibacillus wulumuqiensis]|uniref:peptidylprolyl isomerase n=1 Tax=Paenibacillus wulumuqiensis TaxID=1567107 RepID=UPI000619B8AD|nr:peptidylprolyl isomerase [Paenibacillus wulumuqiensis]
MTKGKSPVWTAVMVLFIVIIMLLGAFWVIRAVQHSGSNSDVAVVGNESISEQEWVSELKKRYGQETLTQMLNRRVVQLEADALHIAVSDEEIRDDLAERMSGYASPQAFYKEMQTQFGLTPQDLQQESRYQIQLEKIATERIEVSDAQVDRYLEQHEQETAQHQYDLAWIETDTEQAAEEAVQRIENGEEFATVAEEMSVDSFSSGKGGALGWIDEDDPFQPPEVIKVIQQMQAGDIVGPVALSTGHYAVVQVRDIRTPSSSKLQISRETARRKVALEQAEPLTDIEQKLRSKYKAYILSASP